MRSGLQIIFTNLLAVQWEFCTPIRSESTPVSLVRRRTIKAVTGWLPWLVEGLKIEDVEAPVKGCTDSFREESVSVRSASFSRLIVRTT